MTWLVLTVAFAPFTTQKAKANVAGEKANTVWGQVVLSLPSLLHRGNRFGDRANGSGPEPGKEGVRRIIHQRSFQGFTSHIE